MPHLRGFYGLWVMELEVAWSKCYKSVLVSWDIKINKIGELLVETEKARYSQLFVAGVIIPTPISTTIHTVLCQIRLFHDFLSALVRQMDQHRADLSPPLPTPSITLLWETILCSSRYACASVAWMFNYGSYNISS